MHDHKKTKAVGCQVKVNAVSRLVITTTTHSLLHAGELQNESALEIIQRGTIC